MDVRKPNVERLLKTISFEEADRVPNFEHYVMRRTMTHVIGEQRLSEIVRSEDMKRFVCLYSRGKTKEEIYDIDSLPIPNFSIGLPPGDNLQLLQATGVDAATPGLTWAPDVRGASSPGVAAYDQKGVVNGWEDVENLFGRTPPPDVERMMALVDWYLDVCRGTGIGVGPMCRSCFCNTYEVMGIENFMLKLHDDIKLVERVLDIFTDYSVKITTELSRRDIDLFWLDDDIAYNNGFVVHPDFIAELWVPRTKEMLKPLVEKNIPICMHCCGNLKDVIPLAIDLGVCGIQAVQPNCNDIYALKKAYGNDMCFFGNLDIGGVLSFGTVEEVVEDTKKHIDGLAVGGGYVVGSSHSVTDSVPPENYLAMIETAQTYGVY